MKRNPLPTTAISPANRLLQALLLLQLLAFSALAQNPSGQTVSGTITDEKNEALTGVNVVEKNTRKGTVNDVNGNFTLTVADENRGDGPAILVFSLIGYTTTEVKLNKKLSLTVSMATEPTGYGVVRRGK